MNTFDKVIFVCNGNTCRSPMAATVMANIGIQRDGGAFPRTI